MRVVIASVLLHLLTTVKTHKAQGKAEHRNVHAGTWWADYRISSVGDSAIDGEF